MTRSGSRRLEGLTHGAAPCLGGKSVRGLTSDPIAGRLGWCKEGRMQLTRRDFLRWLAGVGGALVLPRATPAATEVSPLIVPATPALVVPARRLWALDGTMLTPRAD